MCEDWWNDIFSEGSTIYFLKRKNQCKIWSLENEKPFLQSLAQLKTSDGEISGCEAVACEISIAIYSNIHA